MIYLIYLDFNITHFHKYTVPCVKVKTSNGNYTVPLLKVNYYLDVHNAHFASWHCQFLGQQSQNIWHVHRLKTRMNWRTYEDFTFNHRHIALRLVRMIMKR